MTNNENHTRVIWPGEHKNAIRFTVTRIGKHCWRVEMKDRYIFGVSVTATTVREGFNRALKAVLNYAN